MPVEFLASFMQRTSSQTSRHLFHIDLAAAIRKLCMVVIAFRGSLANELRREKLINS